ncbi:phosphatase PAP2 family protein [Sporolactobacillus sp. THM7-7]|nr:phosphatase PAP2 family protein [Sporolactobacillus sp. THM7-7]
MKADRRSMYPWFFALLTFLLAFLVLVLAIRHPSVRSLDNTLILMLDPIRTPPMIDFFSKLTDFGASRLLIPIIVLCLVFFLYKKNGIAFFLLPIVFFAERGVNSLLKHWIMRERPDFPHLVPETGYSFPSGHTMNAASVYGLLILLAAPLIQTKWLRRLWTAVCLAMILGIGFSRPFLRVHFFSDILAGYCIGGVLVCGSACLLIFIERLRCHDRKMP